MSTDARPSVLVHATEEVLEEYSFGRIHEPQLGWLEEHLLLCSECQSGLEDIEEYKTLMKAGLASFEEDRQAAERPAKLLPRAAPRAGQGPPVRNALATHIGFLRTPFANFLMAAALLLVAGGTTLVWRMHIAAATAPVASVRLIALRGAERYTARAPSGHPLNLVFDRTDLVPDLAYRAEVVDASGRQIWRGGVRVEDQELSIAVGMALRTGAYWVRLYSSSGQLLREFGLNVD